MNFEDNRLYHWLERLSNFFFLNVLWLITSIPVITFFPATAALFAVVRDWVQGKDSGIVSPFFRYFRENLVQSVVVGLLWTAFGAFIWFDFIALSTMSGWLQTLIFWVLVLLTVGYFTTAIYLFPVMVQYRSTWWQVIKNSFLIAGAFPLTTLPCAVVLLVMAVLTFVLPATVLFSASLTAYGVYWLCDRAFQRVNARQQSVEPSGDA